MAALGPQVAALGLWWRLALAAAADSIPPGGHHYPTRGVDGNRSGYSPHAAAPWPLPAKASWISETRGVNRHQTPAIDRDLNVYVGSDAGVLMSFDRIGRLRWMVQVGPRAANNGALNGDMIYLATSDGMASALHKDTGRVVWRTRICDSLPGDTYSPSAFDDFIVFPSGQLVPYGSPDVVCVNQNDGSIRWKMSVGDKYGGATGEIAKNGVGPKYSTVNLAPCYWNGSLIFNDVSGAMFRLSVVDGSEIWYVPGDDKDMYTLGSSCCGPNGKAYLGFSTGPGQGAMQTHDLVTGAKLWRVPFPAEVHSAPAVGYVNGRLTAVVGVGEPTGWPDPFPWTTALRRLLRYQERPQTKGLVVAADAETGEVRWQFMPPVWEESGCAGSTFDQICLPDLWSAPTIDAKGTVWINWSAGGVLYGLRDANDDGTIDEKDPAEVTSYDCGSAATGPAAVAPGMIVSATCRRIVVFAPP